MPANKMFQRTEDHPEGFLVPDGFVLYLLLLSCVCHRAVIGWPLHRAVAHPPPFRPGGHVLRGDRTGKQWRGHRTAVLVCGGASLDDRHAHKGEDWCTVSNTYPRSSWHCLGRSGSAALRTPALLRSA